MKTAEEYWDKYSVNDGDIYNVIMYTNFKKAFAEDRQQIISKIDEMIDHYDKRAEEVVMFTLEYQYFKSKVVVLTELKQWILNET